MSDTTMGAALVQSVTTLAVLRESVAQRTERIKAARAAFDATMADELQNLEADKRALEAEEAAVRGMALVEYETTGNAKPAAGVSVVIGKDYAIDEAAALTWAKVTRMCLVPESVDLKAVQKMASVTELPFVTVTERPSVRIASDLTKAIGAAVTP